MGDKTIKALRTEVGPDGYTLLYSGQALVGSVFYVAPDMPNKVLAGKWAWRVEVAVSPKYLPFLISGGQKTRHEALRAAERAWLRWLDYAGLMPARGAVPELHNPAPQTLKGQPTTKG